MIFSLNRGVESGKPRIGGTLLLLWIAVGAICGYFIYDLKASYTELLYAAKSDASIYSRLVEEHATATCPSGKPAKLKFFC